MFCLPKTAWPPTSNTYSQDQRTHTTMKKLMITAAALMIAVAAHGQGQFLFNTRNLNSTPQNNVTFKLNGAAATGADLFVEVLAGTSEATLAPLGTLALNRTGTLAGYSNPLGATFNAPGATMVGYQAFQGTATGYATATVKSPLLTTTKVGS